MPQWRMKSVKWKMAFKSLAYCLFSLRIIAPPGARHQVGTPDQLHGHRTPRTVPHAIRRAIADTVNPAQVLYDLRVGAVEIFYFSSLIDRVATLRSQLRQLLL